MKKLILILFALWSINQGIAAAVPGYLSPLSLSGTSDGSFVLSYEYKGGIFTISSPDGGETWSSAAVSSERVELRRLHPITLRSGMMLRPIQKDSTTAGVEASMDKGKTWMPFGRGIAINQKFDDGMNRPVLLPLKNGRIALLTQAHGYEWASVSISSDFGQSWSEPKPFFYTPFQDYSLTLLPNGKWLLVKNGRLDQRLCYLPDGLYVYLSDDEGASWYGGMRLDGRMDAVKPVVCAPGNGSIYISWAYAPENGSAAEIQFSVTSEVEIGLSMQDAVKNASVVRTIVDKNKEARAEYEQWQKKLTSPKGDWAAKPIRVATFNIEYKHDDPKRPSWEDRLPYVNWVVREYDFDVMGVQEPFEPEYNDLKALLGDRYESIFASTNLEKPDFSNSIFWKRARVEKLDDGIFWYTENPGQKNGFGGGSSRLCIWAKFRDKETGKIFYHFNSHYDFLSNEAMLLSSRLLLNKIREIAGEYPSFCTGDFNCSDGNPALDWIENSGFMVDAKKKAAKAENAEYSSMRRYASAVAKNGYQLDHIYVTSGSTKVKYWKLIMDEHDGMRGGSDHMPIYIDWILSNTKTE